MKILVALSGGHDEVDTPVVSAAASLPWPAGSEIRVLSVAEVIQPVMVGMIPDAIDAGEMQTGADSLAKETATRALTQFRNRGLQAEAMSLEGAPGDAIVEQARTWGADLIVVGSHERSRMERFFVGSVSETVVRDSPCSVLVVKHGFAT